MRAQQGQHDGSHPSHIHRKAVHPEGTPAVYSLVLAVVGTPGG